MRSGALPLALALALCWTSVGAQTVTARLEGVVTDGSGAAVAGAAVDIIQHDTNIRWSATSDPAGFYVVAVLPPGLFRVEVRHAGFRTAISDGVRLDSGHVARVDAVLAVGQIVDSIEVVAPAASPNRTGSALGVVLGAEESSRLPANGRNYLGLLLALPGVTATHPQSFTVGQRMTSGGRPYVNGNRKETTSYLLDGVDINQHTDNVVSYLPSPDALESVSLTTATASAEWGNYLGGIVAARLKSGTNDWRGSAFGYLRDDALNATNWARKWQPVDPLNPRRKANLEHWTLGGTLGGPLVRNRLFVFTDYQRVERRTGPANGLVTLATPAMRRGDFSALLEGPNPQQLYDPFTTRPDPDRPNQFVRDPFPGNQIPRERFSPVATALFAHPLYPLPAFEGLAGNSPSRSRSSFAIDQGDLKVDAAWPPGIR